MEYALYCRRKIPANKKTPPNIKVTSSLMDPSIEQLRMGMGGVCARQDNTQEWRHVIEISIKEVISGVIAEVLWIVFASKRVNVEKWRM